MAPNALYVGYIVVALVLLFVVYTQSALDLRGVGRVRRRRMSASADEADYEEEADGRGYNAALSEAISVVPRADLSMLIAVFGALGVALGATLGFLGPRLIDAIHVTEEAAPFSWTAAAPLERVAQIVGALSVALIALRMIRVFMMLAALAAAAAIAHIAVAYTLGRPIWEPLGL